MFLNSMLAALILYSTIAMAQADPEYLVFNPSNLKGSMKMTLGLPKKVNLSQDHVRALQKQGFLVERNQIFHVLDIKTPELGVKETMVWPLSLIQADKAHQLPNGKGQGVRICLVDTGVDQNRQGLQGVVLEGRNFLADGDPSDFSDSFPEHGTNLAEVIAGRPFGSFSGVAPEAKLVVAKVFDENGSGSMSSIIDALGYCMNRADVINMSFGGALDSEILSTIMTTVKERGITLIAAAGNTGERLIFPARDRSVIAVGVIDRDSKVPAYSSRDIRLGFVAPGHIIPVPDRHGKLVQVSGSSFSAAFATGVEAIRRSRGAAHLEFRDLGLPQPEQGAGLIDALMTAVSFRPE